MINLITFILYGFDKYAAIHHQWRMSEKTLLILAMLGGSFAAMIAMIIFRHKIRKLKFILLVPMCMVAQLISIHYVVNHMI